MKHLFSDIVHQTEHNDDPLERKNKQTRLYPTFLTGCTFSTIEEGEAQE